MDYMQRYGEWLESGYFDEATKEELRGIAGDEKEIQERFYRDLEFGTGGLRGILGAGTNRMNIYTVRKATQGLANYILAQGGNAAARGVAIAYDSRRMSPEFADESIRVLAANGIKGYVFESLRHVAILSYAVRKFHCIAGIVITASHNPPEYNGYKVYWEDGAQVAEPRDVEIIEEVLKVEKYDDVKSISKEEAVARGLYVVIDESVDDEYIAELKKLLIDPAVVAKEADDFSIVYTPLHGSGNIPVRRILQEIGFKNVHIVKEQELPDGNFPTVDYPNPEDIKAFALALELGKKVEADVIMATDPDADRLGVLARNKAGEFIALNGNNIGVLLLDYILGRKKELGQLPANGAVVETIVSTNMAKTVARHYGVELFEVLTGFKYIGEKIKEFEATGSHQYLFGFEESYGCLIGTHARDKDAIVAVMGVAELAAYYKAKGMTLYEALVSLYEKYGYYKETLQSITLKGIEGVAQIQRIMDSFRSNPPKELAGSVVEEFKDYDADRVLDLKTGDSAPTGLPKSNVLYFEIEGDAWCCVRPSGTEPKVKFYFGVKGSDMEDADAKAAALEGAVMEIVNGIIG
ncbi:phospho-sugar mutase [Anaerotalea alkaliphila]|uniref:Phosphoglucomutase n=1 Tax=Anaerotalea alkaliphila TaxID=2662126 RepID=A0A7X5KMA3_9FIRM|nr:phospho-sugar mutase [Anaerotalea alkaliphila]NDL66749.1 phospho-sugar mutase [Anaerotalea alkaliphila]